MRLQPVFPCSLVSGQPYGVLSYTCPFGRSVARKELLAAIRATRDNASDVQAVVWLSESRCVRVRFSYLAWRRLYGVARTHVEFAGLIFKSDGGKFISPRALTDEEFYRVRYSVCESVARYKKTL